MKKEKITTTVDPETDINGFLENDGSLKWKLPSGVECVVIPGKAKHAIAAGRASDGDPTLYTSALIAQLVTVGGNKMVMEEIPEIALQDYNDIILKLSGANFI